MPSAYHYQYVARLVTLFFLKCCNETGTCVSASLQLEAQYV